MIENINVSAVLKFEKKKKKKTQKSIFLCSFPYPHVHKIKQTTTDVKWPDLLFLCSLFDFLVTPTLFSPQRPFARPVCTQSRRGSSQSPDYRPCCLLPPAQLAKRAGLWLTLEKKNEANTFANVLLTGLRADVFRSLFHLFFLLHPAHAHYFLFLRQEQQTEFHTRLRKKKKTLPNSKGEVRYMLDGSGKR